MPEKIHQDEKDNMFVYGSGLRQYTRGHKFTVSNRGSNNTAHVLLNLFSIIGKVEKYEVCQALIAIINCYFAISLINSITHEYEC